MVAKIARFKSGMVLGLSLWRVEDGQTRRLIAVHSQKSHTVKSGLQEGHSPCFPIGISPRYELTTLCLSSNILDGATGGMPLPLTRTKIRSIERVYMPGLKHSFVLTPRESNSSISGKTGTKIIMKIDLILLIIEINTLKTLKKRCTPKTMKISSLRSCP